MGFKNIHSIEIDDFYYNLNKISLSRFKNIQLYKGSTLDVLPELLEKIDEQSTFWIDSHNDNDCPILKELEQYGVVFKEFDVPYFGYNYYD
jgi:hypothetical protein